MLCDKASEIKVRSEFFSYFYWKSFKPENFDESEVFQYLPVNYPPLCKRAYSKKIEKPSDRIILNGTVFGFY